MKKSIKRTLSLLLALTMVLSLGLPAYAINIDDVDYEEKTFESIDEPIGAKETELTEKDDPHPAAEFSFVGEDGFAVEVSAPEGALPFGAEIRVERLNDLADVQAAVDNAEGLQGDVQLAADISFWLDDQEIEPAEGTKLLVRMIAPEIEGIAEPIVIHIPDGENAVPEIVEQLGSSDIILANTVSFEADDFSVYAVIGEVIIEDGAGSIDFESDDYIVTVTYTEEAKIPVGTKLTVSEIPFDSEDYWMYHAAAQDKLNENAVFTIGSEIDPDTRRGVGDAIFVDVSLEFNGKPFEPAVPLQVKITLKDNALFCPAGEDAYVVHFGAKGTELIEDVAFGLDVAELPEGMPDGILLNSFDYEQNGFSVIGMIATDKYVDYENATLSDPLDVAALNAAAHNPLRADAQIAAGKTVTDNDHDGIYELSLSVTGAAETSTTTEVNKSNVILVIDVSGSMDGTVFSEYTYSADTYSNSNTYRNSASTYGSRVYYNTSREGWFTSQNPNWWDSAYTGTVYLQETRMSATKRAACALVDTLLENNTTENPDTIEISVIKFANYTASGSYNGTETLISKSTSASNIKAQINGLSEGGGTNWAAALRQAKSEADTKYKPEEGQSTSIIFLTDGLPTFYLNRAPGASGTISQQGSGYEDNNNVRDSFAGTNNNPGGAKPYARALIRENNADTGYTFYSIFAYGTTNGSRCLNNLTRHAYTGNNSIAWNTTGQPTDEHFFNATNTEDLEAAFASIAHSITNAVGFAGVSVSDGVSLGATNTSVAVGGTVDNGSMRYTVSKGSTLYEVKFSNDTPAKATFTIYGDGDPVVLTDAEPETVTTTIGDTTINSQVYEVELNGKTYKMSPATIDPATGMVKWDLAGLGILEDGVTYKLSFDVWPNQTAYDIAADLNNGIYPNVDAALAAYNITGEEATRVKNALHHNDDGSYDIQTNYMQEVEFYPATSHTDEETGETVWEYGDKQTQPITQPPAIPLEGSSLPLDKAWEADLAESELNELLWKNGEIGGTSTEYGITLHVWKADTEAEVLAKSAQPISDTNKPYQSYPLGWDETVEGVDKYVWSRDMAVAPGMMVNVAEAERLGFDVTDESKLVSFTPEATEEEPNPEAQLYYVVEAGHYYYVTEDGSDLHFELFTHVYHPMIIDGHLYDLTIDSSTTPATLVEKEPMAHVLAENYLKGGLNIDKVVSSTQIAAVTAEDGTVTLNNVTEVEDCEDEFVFKITLWKEDENGNISPVYTYDDQFGVKNDDGTIDADKAISGSIGYREFGKVTNEETGERETLGRDVIIFEDSTNAAARLEKNKRGTHDPVYATKEGNKTVIELRMPACGEIRIVNLPRGTQYTVEEVLDTSGAYTFGGTASGVKKDEDSGVQDITYGTVNKTEGKIHGNQASVETFYNWAANFYVYHSADNKIEKISFSDNRVKGDYDEENKTYTYTFNIANETKENFLYAGYYKSGFSGAKVTTAEAAAALTYAKATYNTAYDGEHKDGQWASDTTGFAPYLGDKSMWTGTAETANGLKLAVKVNDFFILRECPDVYMQSVLRYTYYDNADQDMGTVWLVGVVDDDTFYKQSGLLPQVVITDGKISASGEPIVGDITDALTITPLGRPQNKTDITVDDLLSRISSGTTSTKGFVLYKQIWDCKDEAENPFLVANDEKTAMFWDTPDGVRVTGIRICSVANIDGTASTIKLTKAFVPSTLTDLNKTTTESTENP